MTTTEIQSKDAFYNFMEGESQSGKMLYDRMLKHLGDVNLVKHYCSCFIAEVKRSRATGGKLLDCSPTSIIEFLSTCAYLGLPPDSFLGLVYPIPRFNKNTKKNECTLMLGYQGLEELAMRDPNIIDINPQAVYKDDDFFIMKGTQPMVEHKPALNNRSKNNLRCFYCIITFKNGHVKVDDMSMDQIERIRMDSKPSGWSPWNGDYTYIEMGRKTIVRNCLKHVRKISEQLQRAIKLDEEQEWKYKNDSKKISKSHIIGPTSDPLGIGLPIVNQETLEVSNNAATVA